MITSWDDPLVLVITRVHLISHIIAHENVILDMGRREVPHRLDIVSKLLSKMTDDGYFLNDIARLDVVSCR